MSEHYYTSRPTSGQREFTFSAELRGRRFDFITDRGVFSARHVDPGSRLLVETVDLEPDAVVLDLGCGYGVIGCAVAGLVMQGQVYMVDVNERAVDLARRNISRNRAENATALLGSGTDPVPGIAFDHVLMNPPIRAGKQVVYALVDQARQALRSQGSLWVVVQTKQGAPSFKRHLSENFHAVTDVARQGGYHVLRATNH